MSDNRMALLTSLLIAFAWFGSITSAQVSETTAWTAHLGTEYRMFTNLTYLTANNFAATLTVYVPRALPLPSRSTTSPNPTLIYFHGGGWLLGTKEHAVLDILPYLEMGWSVVTVDYRLSQVSNAPAAVEDARCALRWVLRQANFYQFDTSRIVLSGGSAGGLLALTTGMLPAGTELDSQCPGTETAKIAAIINWYGITDVVDLLRGPNRQNYAVMWVGSQLNREEVARRVSPLTYVRAETPPILTIHGTDDDAVPYSHSTRLHQELERYRVPNQLLTIMQGGHGGFTRDQNVMIHETIRSFLAKHGLTRTAFAAPQRR